MRVIEPLRISLAGSSWLKIPRMTAYGYDALGRQTKVTEADGAIGTSRTTTRGYDASDNLVWEATPRAYDYVPTPPRVSGADVPTLIPSSLATVTLNTYDVLNRKTSTTAAANASIRELGDAPPVTSWTYDAVGRVVRQVSPADASDSRSRLAVQFNYDSLDQVTHQTEGRWRVAANPSKGTFENIRQSTFAYDGFGNLTREVHGYALSAAAGTQRLQQTDYAYDALGRVRVTEELIDASTARQTLSQYDASGNLTLSTVRKKGDESFDGNRATKYEYDRLGRVSVVTQAWAANQDQVKGNLGHSSPVTTYKYDAQNRLIEATDPRGVKTTSEYDELGRKILEIQGSDQGAAQTAGFVPLYQTYFYDEADRLTWVRTYDLWVVNAEGNDAKFGSVWTEFDYDSLDRKTREIDGEGTSSERHTITTYDAADNALTVTTGYSPTASITAVDGSEVAYSRPVTTGYSYDALGRVRQVLVEAGLSTRPWTSFEYDASGNVTATESGIWTGFADDPFATRTRYEYDSLERVVQTIEGAVASPARDDSQTRRAVKFYDSLDSVTSLVQLGNPRVEYTYDGLGRVTKQTVVGPPVVDTVTDKLLPGSLYTAYQWNVFGEVTEQTDQTGAGATVTSQYDLLGRMKSQVKKGGWENLAYKYDESGNLLKVIDTIYPLFFPLNDGEPQGGAETGVTRVNTTQSAFDAFNRPISQTDTYGNVTQYMYDPLGRVEAIWAPDGKIRWFGYDAVGRRVAEYWNTGTATQAPATGQLISSATAIVTYSDAADRVTYSFQATTNLITTNVPSQPNRFVFAKPTGAEWEVVPYTWTEFGYDAVGRLETESTEGVTLTYGRDAAGRLISVSDGKGGGQKTTYDLGGRVTGLSVFDGKGKGTYFTYDYRGGTDYREDYVKTITGRTTDSKSGTQAVRADITYDALGREKSRIWTVMTGKYPGQKYESVALSYDAVGNVKTESRSGTATIEPALWWPTVDARYTYDKLNQVTKQENLRNGKWVPVSESRYDAAGNVPYASKDEAQKTGNRVTQQGDYKLSYDKQPQGTTGTAGNITTISYQPQSSGTSLLSGTLTQLAATNWTLEYDSRNRLVSAVRRIGTDQASVVERVNYVYDTFDRLVARSVTTNPDNAAIGTNATHYLYADGQPYADADSAGTITVRYLFGPGGQPLARLVAGAAAPDFYLTDRQNSVLQLVDSSANTLKRLKYSGLGAERVGPAASDRFELGGRVYDGVSQLSLLGGRWYAPGVGRYLTESGWGVGLNPYPVPNTPNEQDRGWWVDLDKGSPLDKEWWTRRGSSWAFAPIDQFMMRGNKYLRNAIFEEPGTAIYSFYNSLFLGGPSTVDELFNGPRKRSRQEQMAYDFGDIVGTGSSLGFGYGLLGLPSRAQKMYSASRGLGNLWRGYRAYETGRAVEGYSNWSLNNPGDPFALNARYAKWTRVLGAGLKAYGGARALAGPMGYAMGFLRIPVVAQVGIGGGLITWEVSKTLDQAALAEQNGKPWEASDWAYGFAGLIGGIFGGLPRGSQLAFKRGYASGWNRGSQLIPYANAAAQGLVHAGGLAAAQATFGVASLFGKSVSLTTAAHLLNTVTFLRGVSGAIYRGAGMLDHGLARAPLAFVATLYPGMVRILAPGNVAARGQPFAFGHGTRAIRAELLIQDAALASGHVHYHSLVDHVEYNPLAGSPYFWVDPITGVRTIVIDAGTFGKMRAGQQISGTHEYIHAQQWAAHLTAHGGNLATAHPTFFIPRTTLNYAIREVLTEREALLRVTAHTPGGLTPQQVGHSTRYMEFWQRRLVALGHPRV